MSSITVFMKYNHVYLKHSMLDLVNTGIGQESWPTLMTWIVCLMKYKDLKGLVIHLLKISHIITVLILKHLMQTSMIALKNILSRMVLLLKKMENVVVQIMVCALFNR